MTITSESATQVKGEQVATQAEAPKVTEDQARAAFDSAFPEAGLIKEDVWMTAFRWARLKFSAPTATQAEPTDAEPPGEPSRKDQP